MGLHLRRRRRPVRALCGPWSHLIQLKPQAGHLRRLYYGRLPPAPLARLRPGLRRACSAAKTGCLRLQRAARQPPGAGGRLQKGAAQATWGLSSRSSVTWRRRRFLSPSQLCATQGLGLACLEGKPCPTSQPGQLRLPRTGGFEAVPPARSKLAFVRVLFILPPFVLSLSLSRARA